MIEELLPEMQPVRDCGYMGRELVVGWFNFKTKTFTKVVKYPDHFFVRYNSWGYSVSILDRLVKLGCVTLRHIEKYGDEERVWKTELANYLDPKVYTTRADTKGRGGLIHYTDEQRFVNIKYWRRM